MHTFEHQVQLQRLKVKISVLSQLNFSIHHKYWCFLIASRISKFLFCMEQKQQVKFSFLGLSQVPLSFLKKEFYHQVFSYTMDKIHRNTT
jgi:hypothetical protein